jgi:hypothetical protein
VLAAAYPFLAEAGLGAEGLFIGQDAWSGSSFCYDPWVLYRAGVLTNPNCLLAGVVGKGKSTLGKSLATRSIAFGRKVYVNRPGFDAASFLAKDADHAQEVPDGAAGTCDQDGP